MQTHVQRKVYPSDVSRKQFELIREDLENFKKHTKPRRTDLYEVFCGVLYVLKSGCQWRMLPSDFPKWRTVHEYYRQWSQRVEEKAPSLLEQVLKKMGWRGPYETWKESANQFLHFGRAKR
jgi:transposase